MARKVVVVDDSKFLNKRIGGFFKQELGFDEVYAGYDGNQAVELYEKHRPDLITLDVTMPNKDGVQALEEIIAMHPDANVVMISAARDVSMKACMEKGARACIHKPLDLKNEAYVSAFRKKIESILKNRA